MYFHNVSVESFQPFDIVLNFSGIPVCLFFFCFVFFCSFMFRLFYYRSDGERNKAFAQIVDLSRKSTNKCEI